MGRVSKKANKNIYQLRREELGVSREKASELLGSVPPERIEKIESEKSFPHPDEIMAMAEGYKMPDLCNYYCANDCPLGQAYVPQVEVKELPIITLEMLAVLNRLVKEKDRLIEITVDGKISPDELSDFKRIKTELEKMSMTIDSMQMWLDNTIAAGEIDKKSFD